VTWLRRDWPVIVTLLALIALGYPLALAFGLPLAHRDRADVRKWEKETVVAEAPDDLAPLLAGRGRVATAAGERVAETSVAVLDRRPLGHGAEDVAALADAASSPLLRLSEPWQHVAEGVVAVPDEALAAAPVAEAVLALYAGESRLLPGAVGARERPDGQRTRFTFVGADADGPVLVDGERLALGAGFADDGGAVELERPAPFGADVRRMTADAAVLDAAAGTVALADAAAREVRSALSVVRLAERLQGETDGENRRFVAARERLLDVDPSRVIMVEDRPLLPDAERPAERVDGVQRTFTFPSEAGVIVVDDVAMETGTHYRRDGATVEFAVRPARNARVRQYPGAFLVDPASGTFLLAQAPSPGERVWALRYTFHARPGCGETLLECFHALPQHPVPYPHWIATGIVPFFSKYALADERNALRATLYTTLGTFAALALGAAVGVLLAVAFVLMRPLEQAVFPWVIASQTVPIIALVPVLLLVLGNAGITIQTSIIPTALIGAYIAFFPVVVGTVKGLRSVDPLALDLMRSYAATPLHVFMKVRFPAAVPFLFTSLKLGTAAALVGALVAETESNNRRGLGFQILGQVQSGNVADVWILLLVSALLGIGLVALVGLAERALAPWRRP
jgi:NitT/TauT family transport system permease protein